MMTRPHSLIDPEDDPLATAWDRATGLKHVIEYDDGEFEYRPSRVKAKPVDYDKIVAEGLAEHKARVAADPLYCSKGAKIHYEL